MEDKPLTESINKQYSKYGSLRRGSEKDLKIELCNSEDPKIFLTRIDSSIKLAKARVKQSIDNSTINEEYESSFDAGKSAAATTANYTSADVIPLVKLDRPSTSHQLAYTTTQSSITTKTTTTTTNNNHTTPIPNQSPY